MAARWPLFLSLIVVLSLNLTLVGGETILKSGYSEHGADLSHSHQHRHHPDAEELTRDSHGPGPEEVGIDHGTNFHGHDAHSHPSHNSQQTHGHHSGPNRKAHDHHHHHTATHTHTHPDGSGATEGNTRVWVMAMTATFVVSSASLVVLLLVPLYCGLSGLGVLRRPPHWAIDSLTAFSAAAMLSDAFIHQLPHALSSHLHGNSTTAGLSVMLGIVTFFLIEKVIRSAAAAGGGHGHSHCHRGGSLSAELPDRSDKDPASSPPALSADWLRRRKVANEVASIQAVELQEVSAASEPNTPHVSSCQPPRNMAVAYLNLAADGVHNFTDGMAIGAAFLRGGTSLGWARTLVIIAHELPQEIGDFGMLLKAGFSTWRALLWNFISALTALLGTAIVLATGGAAFSVAESSSALMEAFTAGGFVYIAVGGVMADLAAETGFALTMRQLLSMAVGVLLCLCVHNHSECNH